jgi:hypothetical protein
MCQIENICSRARHISRARLPFSWLALVLVAFSVRVHVLRTLHAPSFYHHHILLIHYSSTPMTLFFSFFRFERNIFRITFHCPWSRQNQKGKKTRPISSVLPDFRPLQKIQFSLSLSPFSPSKRKNVQRRSAVCPVFRQQ